MKTTRSLPQNYGFAENGPVVIGGIGGSGTRLFATLLIEIGFYMGADLSEARDNLWFTLLLKRKRWLPTQLQCGGRGVRNGLRTLELAMVSRDPLPLHRRAAALTAAFEMSMVGHDWAASGRGRWSFERLQRLLRAYAVPRDGCRGWGWKEANSHLILPHLVECFPSLSYLHVMRHGLDMAFSANQAQLYNWAPLYGVEIPKDRRLHPRASLDYWIAANRLAIERCRLFGERFKVVDFDAFCQSPREGVKDLLKFLRVEPEERLLERLVGLCGQPSSIGRYREQDLDLFTAQQLEAVRELGFEVDVPNVRAAAAA